MNSIARACALALSLACGKGPTQVVFDPTADLNTVSSDQKNIAYYVNQSTSGSVGIADLMLQPLPSGTATKLGSNVFSGGFASGGTALTFVSGPTAATDGSAATYGRLFIWAPSLTAPVNLTQGYEVVLAAALDNSTLLYVESATPGRTLGTQTVWLLKTSTCSGIACAPVQLATNATVYDAIVAPGGTYAAYELRTGQAPLYNAWEVWLANAATGATQKVATPLSLVPMAFSRDDTVFATGAASGSVNQLQVLTPATGAPAAWSSPGTGSVTQVGFADSATLIVRTTASNVSSIYRTTATAVTPLITPAYGFLTPRNSTRVVLVQTYSSNAINDLKMFDLQAATPAAMNIASATNGYPTVSEDGTFLRFFENYDPKTTMTGALTVATIPGGTLTTVEQGIVGTAGNFANGGGSKLLYEDPTVSPSVVYEWNAGTSTRVDTGWGKWLTRASPATIYYEKARSGVFSMPLP